MGISNFINDVKEKRVSKLTNEEKVEWLGKKNLDEYTLDLIIKDLKLDIQNPPKDFEFLPSEYKKFSQKQNMARMLVNKFVYGDQIKDKNNYMNYTYCENRANNHFGFEGQLDKDTVDKENLKELKIVLPEKLFNTEIHSFEDAFANTSHLKIDLEINASGFSMNDMFVDSGIIHIPDFKSIDGKIIDTEFCGGPEMDGSWWYENKNINAGAIYNIITGCLNIPLQEKIDFMVEHYNEYNDNKHQSVAEGNKCFDRQRASRYLAEKFFDLPKDQPFITTSDLQKIQKITELSNGDNITKINHLAQIASGQKNVNGAFEKMITKQMLNEFNIKEPVMDKVLPKYFENIDIDKLNISSVEIFGKNGKKELLYLITTDDNVGTIYNPTHNTFDYAGKINDINSIILNDKYINFNFEHIQREEYSNILNDIKLKNSELSNDVLENDNISVPETNTDEKEQEI